jgi:hypothetical protein
LLRGQPSWPRGKLTTNRKQPVVATIKVANNSNNNNNNNNKQGQKRKDRAPYSAALKKVTTKVHNPSLEKGCSSRTKQKERHPIRPRRPSPEVAEYIDLEEKEIIKQFIKATIKRGRDNFKVQEVTFFQALQSKAKCSKVVQKAIQNLALSLQKTAPSFLLLIKMMRLFTPQLNHRLVNSMDH